MQCVKWRPLEAQEPGCTAVIGVCSRLPAVLAAKLRCLHASRWAGLKGVLAVVDGTKSALPRGLEKQIGEAYPELNIQFLRAASGCGCRRRCTEACSSAHQTASRSSTLELKRLRADAVIQ